MKNGKQLSSQPNVSSMLEALHLGMMAKRFATTEMCEEIDRRFSARYGAFGKEALGWDVEEFLA